MPEAFKNNFNLNVINDMSKYLAIASNALGYKFNDVDFVKMASHKLDTLELKARSNQISAALLKNMPQDFVQAAAIITRALAPASKTETIQFKSGNQGLAGWMMMPITDYVAHASLQPNATFLNEGLKLLHACTQRFSAEFSIRPFLRDHTDKTLSVLHDWAGDDSVHVRRLVSEGTRPYLPWGLRLHVFAKDPSPILPLLEHLKNDASEYVRRSVANNLNDIAKDNPDLVVQIAHSWWDESNKARTKLIKHACRTLLKNGHPDALALFGYPPAKLDATSITVSSKSLKMGDEQFLTLKIENKLNSSQQLLVDYAMHHQKANGKMSLKVFKWTSLTLAPNTQKTLVKKHSFKAVTTRKYYAGKHKVEVLINGKTFASDEFDLC